MKLHEHHTLSSDVIKVLAIADCRESQLRRKLSVELIKVKSSRSNHVGGKIENVIRVAIVRSVHSLALWWR